jgi:hypothetical protein
MTNHDKLTLALKLIIEVDADQNARTSECPTCGHHTKENWDQWQTHESLKGTIQKLEKLLTSGREL